MSQDSFLSCYRGRQSAWHHAAYMRMSKVLLGLRMIREQGIGLAEKSIFDYGFGAGTFFRYCPPSAGLFGVELDAVCVAEVTAMLTGRGHGRVDLQTLDLQTWKSHPLLQRSYDLIICSHVLEHLPGPEEFLRRMRRCLTDSGSLIGLVPINERQPDPHHVREMSRATLESWLTEVDLTCVAWVEADPWLYWIQPLFTHESGWRQRAAQVVSLLLGILATVLRDRWWQKLSLIYGRVTCSQPTQAVFVLQPRG